jgi:hypothetical protein
MKLHHKSPHGGGDLNNFEGKQLGLGHGMSNSFEISISFNFNGVDLEK